MRFPAMSGCSQRHGKPSDAGSLLGVCFRRKLRPHHVTGDAKCGTTVNIVAIEHAGIRADVPLPDFESARPSTVGTSSYTMRAGSVRCPEGQPLPRYRAKHTEEVVAYRIEAVTCNAQRLGGF
jgi:hypothetical protein